MCLARELLGSAAESAVREVNASDDRGIKVVRDTCREFAERQVDLPAGQYKLIILDEADRYLVAPRRSICLTLPFSLTSLGLRRARPQHDGRRAARTAPSH